MLKTQARDRIVSTTYHKYQAETIFRLNGLPIYRRDVGETFHMSSTRAFTNLQKVCKAYNIRSERQLFRVGLSSLMDATGVGEVTALAAAHVLDNHGEDVMVWIDAPRFKTIEEAVRAARQKKTTRARRERRAERTLAFVPKSQIL